MSSAKAEIDGVVIAEATAWETVEGNVYVGDRLLGLKLSLITYFGSSFPRRASKTNRSF
jgi:hypothetical protein